MNVFARALETVQEMVDGAVAALPRLAVGAVAMALFWLLANRVRALIERLANAGGLSITAARVVGRLGRWATLGFGLLVGLSIAVPSFTAGEVIQLLGISGVAIGFAFRDILQNLLAGLLLLLTQPFRIGDQIVVSEYEGTVDDIETRATTIRTYDGRRVVIPNSDLFTKSVTVNTAFDRRRSEYVFGIGFGDDIGLATRLILEVLQGAEGILQDPAPDVLVSELGDFSVNLKARWWTPSPQGDVLGIKSQVITRVKETLLDNGIDLPFPTQQVLFHDQTEETDGDRRRQREGWPAGKGQVPEPGGMAKSLREWARTSGKEGGFAGT